MAAIMLATIAYGLIAAIRSMRDSDRMPDKFDRPELAHAYVAR